MFFMLVCGGTRRLGQSLHTWAYLDRPLSCPQRPKGVLGRDKANYLWLFPSTRLGLVYRPSQLCLLPRFPSCRAKGLRRRRDGWSSGFPESNPTPSTPSAQQDLQPLSPGYCPLPHLCYGLGTSFKDTVNSTPRWGPLPPSLAPPAPCDSSLKGGIALSPSSCSPWQFSCRDSGRRPPQPPSTILHFPSRLLLFSDTLTHFPSPPPSGPPLPPQA